MSSAKRREAYLEATSPILLKNTTIEHLRNLSMALPVRTSSKMETFDELIIELIKVYRKRKGLSDLWSLD